MGQYTSYWSCSDFADWLRGGEKPHALGWDEWEVWHAETKAKHPVRYFLAETGLSKLQDFVYFPVNTYRDIRYYIINRFVDKTHYLRTGLEPGRYFEVEHRILYGVFEALVDFVEGEKASMERCWNRDGKGPSRSRELGFAYLDWEISLTDDEGNPTRQARAAQETKDLFIWWKDVRPNRPDPMDVYKDVDNIVEDDNTERFETVQRMDQEYEDEDTAMLIRLIKIRKELWT